MINNNNAEFNSPYFKYERINTMDNKIYCKACHCKYHNEKDECEASEIMVGNPTASCSKETCCDTFISKN